MKMVNLLKYHGYCWKPMQKKKLYAAAEMRKKMRQESLEKNRALYVEIIRGKVLKWDYKRILNDCL